MNVEYSGIKEDDVFEIFARTRHGRSNEGSLHSTGKIYRFDQVLKALNHLSHDLSKNVYNSLKQQYCEIDLRTENFLNSGIDCKVLGSESSGWKSGRLEIRVQIDFIPDAPQEPESVNFPEKGGESELDEIRKLA